MIDYPDNPDDALAMDEESLMPFGKHKGARLADVPASYLMWFYEQPWAKKDWPLLYSYVEENEEGLSEDAAYEEGCAEIDYNDMY